jgi:hypothetical protein
MYALWAHGNVVIPQAPAVTPESVRTGRGVSYDFGPYNHPYWREWFHAPLPTLTIADDHRAHIRRVMILGSSDLASDAPREHRTGDPLPFPHIIRVDIWDGPHGIGKFPTDLHGNFADDLQEPIGTLPGNVFNMSGQQISWGLGVSIHVEVPHGGALHFASIGVDLDYR